MKDIKEITKQLEDGVKGVFNSDSYRQYLSFMGKFHHYSINNSILIWIQMPTASHVAGYKAWMTKFNRQVRKGEKGITILAPCPHKFKKEVQTEDGFEEKTVEYMTYHPCTVFDISQTDGDEVPSICNELTGDVDNYEDLLERLKKVAPCGVGFEDIKSGALGYYSPSDNEIRVKNGMSQVQTVKTLVHEIAHAMMHNSAGEEKDADRYEKEVQAESVAYTVCTMLGISTDGYSFEYVADWSKSHDAKELVKSMEVIRRTANTIYEGVAA